VLIKKPVDIDSSEITSKRAYEGRRSFISSLGRAAFAAASPALPALGLTAVQSASAQTGVKMAGVKSSPLSIIEKATPYKDVTTYNNYYEFGTDKADPAQYAKTLKPRPWSVMVEGAVKKPRAFAIEDLLKLAGMEERIYRMRCVEGWSMVIPWVGYPLAELIRQVEPLGNAKFIEFITLADKTQMPGVHVPVLAWPYTEGLRMDEAMHPLTLLTFGLYGELLPNQNGAPVRITVPWKYGFKSGKSIVKIRFTEEMPQTSWNRSAPQEYGFYSNVNPAVTHPRWSQATERRIGEDGFLQRKRATLPFNGYADQVASLYAGMDLKQFF
jgi:methionine sulfoxide reductase catalytic subunit